jgi:hypothetical protein
MRKPLSFSLAVTAGFSLLTGCGMSNVNPTNPVNPSGGTVPVSISMTDDPPQGVQVLFFQVSLTAASLTPSSGSASSSPVSLLNGNTPIQIDVTQLQALSAFLSTANVAPGSYSGLSLTFASPMLVIFNASDSSIASTCAVGSVCQLTPTIDDNSATVDLTSSPFPVTVSANTPLGFLVDFHLNTIIQTDLSVNLGVTNGITVGELPSMPQPRFGFLNGTVESVNASQNQFTLQTLWGRTFTIETDSSTTFSDFPTSACSSAGIGCLAQGQDVQVQVSGVASGGILEASQVTYEQMASQQTVEGVVVGFNATAVKLLLHGGPSASAALPWGGVATVTFASGATFSVDAQSFTIPSGFVFTGVSNLAVGQELQVNVVSGTLEGPGGSGGSGGWGPPPSLSFTTNTVQLEPGQVTGTITSLSSPAFALQIPTYPNCFAVCPAWIALIPVETETTSQTTYQGFNTDSFSGLAVNDTVSVNGWLFEADNGLTDPAVVAPEILAQTVADHPNAMF